MGKDKKLKGESAVGFNNDYGERRSKC